MSQRQRLLASVSCAGVPIGTTTTRPLKMNTTSRSTQLIGEPSPEYRQHHKKDTHLYRWPSSPSSPWPSWRRTFEEDAVGRRPTKLSKVACRNTDATSGGVWQGSWRIQPRKRPPREDVCAAAHATRCVELSTTRVMRREKQQPLEARLPLAHPGYKRQHAVIALARSGTLPRVVSHTRQDERWHQPPHCSTRVASVSRCTCAGHYECQALRLHPSLLGGGRLLHALHKSALHHEATYYLTFQPQGQSELVTVAAWIRKTESESAATRSNTMWHARVASLAHGLLHGGLTSDRRSESEQPDNHHLTLARAHQKP